jgi:DNA-binding transcriptional MocR family regulator
MQLRQVEAALDDAPVAVFLQPRAQNPTGVDMSKTRARALARLFAGKDLVIVEDDHSAEISGSELVSLGAFLPEQVLRIHSFSKSHGPDLRLAAIGGVAEPLKALIRRRQLGPSWSSRLLQHILLDMLRDKKTERAVLRAEQQYLVRRNRLREELLKLGIETGAGSGLNLWVPVADDQSAVVALAAYGIGVSPGRPFEVSRAAQDHIRVTTAGLGSNLAEVAKRIAEASAIGRRQLRF